MSVLICVAVQPDHRLKRAKPPRHGLPVCLAGVNLRRGMQALADLVHMHSYKLSA